MLKTRQERAARILALARRQLTKAVNDQASCINTSRRRLTMNRLPFDTFFQIATGNMPYDY
jgi:hypothetical protein